MKIISVDLQNEFAAEGGGLYRPRPCVPFLQDTFIPFVRDQGYKVAEIISDYRATPPETGASACVPGKWGYLSQIPADVKHNWVWVKAETSPAWIREGGGEPGVLPGAPYLAPQAFSEWLSATIGPPDEEDQLILMGLMLEICVLCTLQELRYRGYRASVLFEGVDTYSGDTQQKHLLFETLFPFWGRAIYWREIAT
jgi:nicotinamidase-related amidase